MRKGFTLVEILISLTVVGLLFGFGFVNFRDFSRRQQVLGEARAVAGELRLAQSKATVGEKPADVKCTGVNTLSSYGFQILDASSYKIVANCSGGSVDIKSGSISDDIFISPTSGTVLFKVLGEGTNIVAGESFVITLTQTWTLNSQTVTVNAGGEIK